MGDRLSKIVIAALVVVLAVYFAQPYVDRWMFSASTPRAVAPRGSLSEIERTSIEVFERVSPSVVQVVGRAGALEAPEAENGRAQSGSGFVWDGAGHIVTNDHVVEGTSGLAVRFASGQVQRAQVVGTAPNYDLAVIRVDNPRSLPPPIAIGTSEDLKVGQWVFAIGNPFGLDQSLTTGIISALKRRLPTSGGREITNVIQTDAAINPGNSGGPLFNMAGEVVGMNSQIYSRTGGYMGLSFAIPIDAAVKVKDDLVKYGKVSRGRIGVTIQDVDKALADSFGLEKPQGALVSAVEPGSPADKAGLRPGDIIVAVDGKPVRSEDDLRDVFESAGVGATVTLTVIHQTARRDVRVSLVQD